jgi:Tfp pilus assembly protein PilV
VTPKRNRKGFSLVELQIAFLVFAIAVSGLGPLIVMQSRHLKRIESRFTADTIYYLAPSNDAWARKLGAGASLRTYDPGSGPAAAILVIDDADDGFTVLDSSGSSGKGKGKGVGKQAASVWTAASNSAAYLSNCYTHEGGTGENAARWEFSGLPAGWYDVRVTWPEDSLQSTTAPFTVYEGTVSKGEFPINQQVAPSGDEIDGRAWQSLGIFSTSSGVLAVELTDAADDPVVADAVRLIPVRNKVQVDGLERSLQSEEVTAHVTVTVEVPE